MSSKNGLLDVSSSGKNNEDTTYIDNCISVPLRQWFRNEARGFIAPINATQNHLRKASLLRMVTSAYAIAELLRHASKFSSPEWSSSEQPYSIDNFLVLVSKVSDSGWEVVGMDTRSPALSLRIVGYTFSSNNFFDEVGYYEISGREILVKVVRNFDSNGTNSSPVDESNLCYCFGVLLYGLFTGAGAGSEIVASSTIQGDDGQGTKEDDYILVEPVAKKSSLSLPLVYDAEFSHATSISESSSTTEDDCRKGSAQVAITPLGELGYPTSLSQLVKNLVDCGMGLFRPNDSYPSLELAICDLQLLLQYPQLFLFKSSEALSTMKGQRASLYGRSSEADRISDAFCRVILTGKSEAFLIGGFSGCGKTSLVESVFVSVRAAGGYVMTEKFDEISSRGPISVVLSTLNEFCIAIAKNSDPDCLLDLYHRIINEFGTNLHFLLRAVPCVTQILSAGGFDSSVTNDVDDPFNFHNLCFTIQRFMRIVSCPSRPLLLFLDDIQWADPISLELLHAVLSDPEGESCLLFVGTYRDNELKPDHIIFGFVDMLSQFDVQSTDMHLDGLVEDDVGFIISEALGILPRQCQSLAKIVCRKTKGNPFFVLEFLRSLIDRGIVQYSLRERRWTWDTGEIGTEDITDNVLHLLGRKLTSLPSSEQLALKVASCFGIKTKASIVPHLNCFASESAFHKLVEDGYMDFDGSYYRFVHDKVREAAYQLIGSDCTDQYHFNIGMEMLGKLKADGDYLLATIEQINHGVHSLLRDESDRIAVAELNYEAAFKSMQCSDYSLAHGYMKTAVELLPDDPWPAYYAFSLKCYLHLAKSSFPCGSIDEAKDALNQIINNGKCLDDKLDAYLLLVSIQYFALEADQAIGVCIRVNGLLGEYIPSGDVHNCQIVSTIAKSKEMFDQNSEDDLFRLAQNEDKRNVSIMKFYNHLVNLTMILKPKLRTFYMALWARFAVTSKVHIKYAAVAFVGFGSGLCNELTDDVMLGYRIGKMGLMFLNQFESTDDESRIQLLYYTNLGFLFEPFQACLDMHYRGYKTATQYGDSTLAASHLFFAVQNEIFMGNNLSSIKTKIGGYLKISDQLLRFALFLKILYNVVLALLGEKLNAQQNKLLSPVHEQVGCTLEMMSSFYNGHYERVKFLDKKLESLRAQNGSTALQQIIYTAFYSGLATTALYRSKETKKTLLLKDIPKKFLPILTKAAECSEWNYTCKASLLRAEYLSLKPSGHNSEAEHEYEKAICGAQSSRFVHEEGLACERAGMHYKQCGNHKKAFALFQQAKKCFEDWGAQKRVEHIANEMALLLALRRNS